MEAAPDERDGLLRSTRVLGDDRRVKTWTRCVVVALAALGIVALGVREGVESTGNARSARPTLGDARSARSTLGDAHGISQACLDACKSVVPDLVAAIEASPMDCDVIRDTPDASCLFTAPECEREPGDNLELDVVIDRMCPLAVTDHVVPPNASDVTVNISELGAGRASHVPIPKGPQRPQHFRVFTGTRCLTPHVLNPHASFFSSPITAA